VKTSPNGLAFVTREEGEVDRVYSDQVGVPTIGVGHALRAGESYPSGITHEQAEAFLAQDVATAEAEVNRDVRVPLTQSQFDALVDFTFNCGTGAMHSSSALAKLNAGDYAGCADALLLWDKGTIHGHLVLLPVLLARRTAERALFLAPDVPSDRPTEPETPLAIDHTSERDDEAQAVADEPPDPPAAA
jgi:lysozyme